MPKIIIPSMTPEERAFQRRVDAVWESARKVDDRISRAWVEASLRGGWKFRGPDGEE